MDRIKSQRGIAPFIVILILLGLAGVGGSIVYIKNKNKAITLQSPVPTPTMPMTKVRTMTIKLNTQNNSKQAGEVVLTEVSGKVKVVLSVSGAPSGISQPAHVHVGACPTPGAVKYPLTAVTKGASQTTIDTTLQQLVAGLPLAINVHKSSAEAGVYIACGDLTADTVMDKMMNKKDAEDMMGGMMEEKKGDEMMGNSAVKEFSMTSWYDMVDGKPATHFSISEIKVKKGDTVRIKVTNTKGNHDFALDEYGIKVPTPLDKEVTIEFKADKAGSFKYYCSMPGHRMMGQEGTLIVEE